VLGVLCSSIGSVMATETIKLLTGTGRTLIGRLLVFNALDLSFDEVELRSSAGHGRSQHAAEAGEDEEAAAGPPFDPPRITAPELAGRLADRRAGRDDFELIDVRGSLEHDIVAVPGARVIPL